VQGLNLNWQADFWNREGSGKEYHFPVDFEQLDRLLEANRSARILEFGCGYGRVAVVLHRRGYAVEGVDPSAPMIELARERCSSLKPPPSFRVITSPRLPHQDETFDAALLVTVLTCIPTDEGQRAVIRELFRVLRPGGILCIGDLSLQDDPRNIERYVASRDKYGIYGVFELPEGAVLRHHDLAWIDTLTSDFERVAIAEVQVITMNGNQAKGFQWYGRKPLTKEYS
jgi:SAM-dependent methyltransferase